MKYCNKHQNTLIKCQESRRKKQTVARAESPASVRARPPTPGHRRRKQSRNLPVGETKKHTMRLSRLYKSKVGEQQRERERESNTFGHLSVGIHGDTRVDHAGVLAAERGLDRAGHRQ
jgi:hypothetical protein